MNVQEVSKYLREAFLDHEQTWFVMLYKEDA